MRITVLTAGKLKEKYLVQAEREYLKRLRSYAKVEIKETADESFSENDSPKTLEKIKEKEGRRLIRALNRDSFVIALERHGDEIDSRGLAAEMEELCLRGKSDVTFVIGGSLGLAPEVLQAAGRKLSFSRLTFPHQLMRIILLEQLFRSFKIRRGEPYHR